MATARGLTEGEVASGFYHCLIAAIKDAKRNGVLDNTDLASGDEQWLVIYGLSLHLLYSAKLDTTLPSIELSCPEDSDRRLDASASPPEFRPYFDRWASLIPRIRPLPQYYTHDLALLICRKLPITLPREFPDPLPFFPTPEQQALEDIRELSSKLNMISNAISQYGSFSPLWKGKLRAALSEESQMIRGEQVPAIITDDMTLPEVVAVLVRHSCPNITRELMFSSSATHYLAGSRYYSNISRGTLRDMSQVAIGFSRSDIADSESENERLTRTARGVFAWSLCHHPNVLPLIGLAEFRGQLAMVSPWMNNGNISDYVNKQPGADRFNLCTQIAYGLTYLHSIGVVHVDVKGTNILMSDSGVPMLGGFANSISTNSAAAAPEILRGSNPSMAADVFLEVLTGKLPYFERKTELGVVTGVLIDRIKPQRPLDDIPPNDSQGDMLWTLMNSCWLYEPEDRPTAEHVYKTMKPFVIDSTMVASEVIAHLGSRSCPDLSDQLNDSLCRQYPLSNGGYGDVYRGVLNSGESVALKSMIFRIGSSRSERELLKDTARERYVWSKCKHENVIQLLGLAMFRNQIAMVSPWMEKGNLMSYIKRNAGVDRCRLSAQVACGLAYLHQIEMVHGDLKAANVLISDQGVAMLTDFGNAFLSLSTVKFAGTETGCKISVRWTAPELMSDGAKHSRQADVYALGMTILESLTGEVPFANKRDDPMVICAVVLKKRPERPECIPSDSHDGDKLWSLLNNCWSHEQAERPTASEVWDMMQTITKEGLLTPS